MPLKKGDFSKICRLCLLFKKEMITLQIPEVIQIIKICVDVEVRFNDGFPQTICCECSEQIYKYSAFRQLCKNSDEILHKIVNGSDISLKNNGQDTIFNTLNVKKEFVDCVKDEPFDNDHNLRNVKIIDSNYDNHDDATCNEIINTSESDLLTKKELRDASEDESKQESVVNNISSLKLSEQNESHVNKDILNNESNRKIKAENCTNLKNCTKTVEGTVHCRICNKHIPENRLGNHTKRHCLKKKHRCDLCPRSFEKPCELVKHLQIIHRKKGHLECQTCKKKFNLQIQLDLHLKSHLKKDKNCNVCGREFTDNSNLRRHKKIHEKRDTVYCLHCGKTYMNEEYLKRHIKRSHSTESESAKDKKMCPVCGKVVLNIKIHTMRTHDKYTPFKCNQCNKAFIFNALLVKHIKEKHLGVKKETKALCPICGKACPTQGDLRKHSIIHDDSRKYDCDLCNKTYKYKRGLQNHLMVHKGIRPFGCSFCSKRFFSKQQLKHHILIHTGEKPFSCHICGRRFNQKSARQTHMKVHNV